MNILEIRTLSVEYYRHGVIPALRGVSLDVAAGESVAIVGESGSGKSTLAHAVLGLILPGEGKITAGEIRFKGRDLTASSLDAWRTIRGKDISIVFQDPFASLNPVLTIEDQLTEAVLAHRKDVTARAARELAFEALTEVRFSDPGRILASYPHQLSGGQRQRIVIASAIINRPKLLIADEPTTALDVTIQKEIMDLIDTLKKELSLTVLLITHNLPLAAERCDRIAVMYAGEIVECGRKQEILREPRHPYTVALLSSVPRLLGAEKRFILSGQPPDVRALPEGCAFWPRCTDATEACRSKTPSETGSGDRTTRCFKYE